MSEELSDLTRRLGENYDRAKEYERAKNRLREEFFARVTDELSEEVAPQIVTEYETDDEEQALRQAQRQYVRHSVVATKRTESGYQVILQEDPGLRPFQYVNPADGRVYQRIVSEGSPVLDDEAIREEKPELWEAITHEVTKRELKPLENLTPEQIADLEPYIALPKPQVRLAAPRKAKPEELDNDDS
jgi:hypothetical protein